MRIMTSWIALAGKGPKSGEKRGPVSQGRFVPIELVCIGRASEIGQRDEVKIMMRNYRLKNKGRILVDRSSI